MKNAYTEAHNAVADAERQFVEDGGERAKAEAETNRPECPCCMAYNRPGMIYNAGQWLRCPMCNAAHATVLP